LYGIRHGEPSARRRDRRRIGEGDLDEVRPRHRTTVAGRAIVRLAGLGHRIRRIGADQHVVATGAVARARERDRRGRRRAGDEIGTGRLAVRSTSSALFTASSER
jgi:hypothetical protein